MTEQKTYREKNERTEIAKPRAYGPREAIHESCVSSLGRDSIFTDKSGRVLRQRDYVNGFYIVSPLLDKEEAKKILETHADRWPTEPFARTSRRYDDEITHARSIGIAHDEYEARFVKPKRDLEKHRFSLGLEEPNDEFQDEEAA